uniref:Uncharacterized protein n=1 Tax=Pristionchus pacificus TaxID=54126 RepID=A0A2A6C1B2_PRIPA|eukprot:PDM72042.1 hypothetical protein PRIPAC_38449 [Pristionchus pacificus]
MCSGVADSMYRSSRLTLSPPALMLLVEQLGNFLQSFPLIRTVVDRLLDELSSALPPHLRRSFAVLADASVSSEL